MDLYDWLLPIALIAAGIACAAGAFMLGLTLGYRRGRGEAEQEAVAIGYGRWTDKGFRWLWPQEIRKARRHDLGQEQEHGA